MILTVNDLAKRWQCSIGQIYKQVKAGALPHFLIGLKGIRFRLKDIEDYECAWSNTEANGASTTETQKDNPYDARLVRMTEPRQNDGYTTGEPSRWLVPPGLTGR